MINFPSELKDALVTVLEWPSRSSEGSLVQASQTLAVPSSLQVKI
jgi:hypothetical protein